MFQSFYFVIFRNVVLYNFIVDYAAIMNESSDPQIFRPVNLFTELTRAFGLNKTLLQESYDCRCCSLHYLFCFHLICDDVEQRKIWTQVCNLKQNVPSVWVLETSVKYRGACVLFQFAFCLGLFNLSLLGKDLDDLSENWALDMIEVVVLLSICRIFIL